VVRAVDLLKQGRNEELWQMCCGYLKLSMEEFMDIQNNLLLEQIKFLNNTTLGKKIMPARPQTIEEFRNIVPLTTYKDYCPELSEKNDEVLPEKPEYWIRTSGKSGEYSWKWVPMSSAYAEEFSKILFGLWMLSSCNGWGDASKLREHMKIVYTVAPPPYISGTIAEVVLKQIPIDFLPSYTQSKTLDFEARTSLGFRQALSYGLDCFFGLSLVLVVVGEKFSQSAKIQDLLSMWNQPKALMRLAKGLINSKRAKRPMLPRDLWKVNGILTGGLDSSVYREKINKLWGRYPLDVYASTEGGIVATQTWDYEGMTFVPSLNYLEFIPEEEHLKWRLDNNYQPKTILLNEVKPDQVYEIVLTNFHGGTLVRYRIGDMIRITSLQNEKLGILIPQMAFERRADDIMDFAFLRLSEKNVWQAIEELKIPYEDWVAYKNPGESILNIMIEFKEGVNITEAQVSEIILPIIMQSDLEDSSSMVDFHINTKILPAGTFPRYLKQRQKEGADLAHLKPPHINPSAKIRQALQTHAEATYLKVREEAAVSK